MDSSAGMHQGSSSALGRLSLQSQGTAYHSHKAESTPTLPCARPRSQAASSSPTEGPAVALATGINKSASALSTTKARGAALARRPTRASIRDTLDGSIAPHRGPRPLALGILAGNARTRRHAVELASACGMTSPNSEKVIIDIGNPNKTSLAGRPRTSDTTQCVDGFCVQRRDAATQCKPWTALYQGSSIKFAQEGQRQFIIGPRPGLDVAPRS